jgi:hypothetical protein
MVSYGQSVDRDTEHKLLEEERRTRQLERSIQEQARIDALKPPARDAKLCESARINYQSFCGSPFAPRSRSKRCAEADLEVRQRCSE